MESEIMVMNTFRSVTPTYRGAGYLLWLMAVLLAAFSPQRADEVKLRADFSLRTGAIRPLHGINKGPLAPGGIFDVIKELEKATYQGRQIQVGSILLDGEVVTE